MYVIYRSHFRVRSKQQNCTRQSGRLQGRISHKRQRIYKHLKKIKLYNITSTYFVLAVKRVKVAASFVDRNAAFVNPLTAVT